jgi:hypothetical protein
MAKPKRGRPSKLTPAVQAGICKAITEGLTYEQSAILNGISESTFYAWKANGEKAKSGRYVDFLDSIKVANIKARMVHLQRIEEASKGGEAYEETTEIIKTAIDPSTGNEVVVAREVKTIRRVMLPCWTASAWILERRFSSEFGRHVQPQQVEERDPLQEWLESLDEAKNEYEEAK